MKKFILATPRIVVIGIVFLAVMVMGTRLTDMFAILSGERDVPVVMPSQADEKATTEKDKAPSDTAKATTTAEEKKVEAKADEKKEPDKAAETKAPEVAVPAVAPAETADAAAEAKPEEKKEAEKTAGKAPENAANPGIAPSSSDFSGDVSDGEREVLKQLSARRMQLEKREKEIEQRGALMLATEKRVDQKLKEMELLRSDLNKILANVNDQKGAEFDNLVKIYSAMKPAEAARILSNMDMPVLLGVIRQMKPAASAPILAAMDAQRAQEITTQLTRSYDLPGGAP